MREELEARQARGEEVGAAIVLRASAPREAASERGLLREMRRACASLAVAKSPSIGM